MAFDDDRVVTLTALESNTEGQVRFAVSDPEGNSDERLITVALEDPPELTIPDQIIAAGPLVTIELASFLSGGKPGPLLWELEAGTGDVIDVALNAVSGSLALQSLVMTQEPVEFAVVANTESNLVIRETFSVSIAAASNYSLSVPDAEMQAGTTLLVELAQHLSGEVPDDVSWRLEGLSVEGLAAAVDSGSGSLTLTASEDALLTTLIEVVSEAPGVVPVRASFSVTVTQGLLVIDFADLTLRHGETVTLQLDGHVVSGPVQLLDWSVEGGTLIEARVPPSTRQLVVTAPATGEGSETVTARATSPDGQEAEQTFTVSFPLPLEVAKIPDILMVAGTTDSTQALDDLVLRGIVGLVVWSAQGANRVEVEIDSEAPRRLRVTAPDDSIGDDLIFISAAFAGFTISDTVLVTVRESLAVIEIDEIPNIEVVESEVDSSIFLDAFIRVGDPEEVVWSVSGAQITSVEIDDVSRQVRIRSLGPIGQDTLVFTGTVAAESDSDSVVVTVAKAPSLQLADREFQITRGSADSSLVLDDFVAVGDPDLISWTVDGGIHVKAVISPSGRIYLDASEALAGREVFEVQAFDGQDSNTALLSVSIVAPAFSLENVPVLRVEAGQQTSLDLNELVRGDFSPSEIIWKVEGAQELTVSIQPDTQVLIVRPESTFFGPTQAVVTATTPLGDDRVLVLEFDVTGAPIVEELPTLFVLAGTESDVLDLDEFAPPEETTVLVWRVTGSSSVVLSIDSATNVLNLQIPASFSGTEVRQLAVRRNPGELEGLVDLVINVQGTDQAPELLLPPKIVFGSGERIQLDLDTLVNDPDTEDSQIVWTVSSQSAELVVEFETSSRDCFSRPPDADIGNHP